MKQGRNEIVQYSNKSMLLYNFDCILVYVQLLTYRFLLVAFLIGEIVAYYFKKFILHADTDYIR